MKAKLETVKVELNADSDDFEEKEESEELTRAHTAVQPSVCGCLLRHSFLETLRGCLK